MCVGLQHCWSFRAFKELLANSNLPSALFIIAIIREGQGECKWDGVEAKRKGEKTRVVTASQTDRYPHSVELKRKDRIAFFQLSKHTPTRALSLDFSLLLSLFLSLTLTDSPSHSTWSHIRWWLHWAARVPATRAGCCAPVRAPLSPRWPETELKYTERKTQKSCNNYM